ncbi:MAG: amidohydrolase family protein [Solirubrobacteraceae bacterium]
MQRVDLHQHIWTTPLMDALARRDCHPFVRRDDGLCVLHLAGEPSCVIDTAAETAASRTQLLDDDGLDLAAVAISSPIGIETLAPDQAHELIGAHLDGVLALGDRFVAWGPISIRRPDPADVDAVLARGCVGISLPSAALADLDAFAAIRPVLERVQELDVPLFVHPGGFAVRQPSLSDPLWWPALTSYVSDMQAAWLTFVTHGRRELPRVRVLFAMLAGGAPLQTERLTARGGPAIDLQDPLTFYDTSSYGPMMIEAMAAWLGPDRLVYGSDRPVIEPVHSGRGVELMTNAAEFLISARAVA